MALQEEESKPSPSAKDLLAWFIWEKIGTSPVGDFECPMVMRNWLTEFESKTMKSLHDHFYDRYSLFVDSFCDPDETGGVY